MRSATSVSAWAIALLAVAGLGIWAVPSSKAEATAESKSEVGKITGIVMKDGKPVAGARVGLIDQSEVRKARQGAKGQAADGAGAKPGKPGKPDGAKPDRVKPTPVATTNTDSDGKFTINDVKAGDYIITAGAKGEGRGRTQVSVVAGQTANVEINVQAAPEGGPKPGKPGKPGKVKPAK